jgi:hypothetical protein
MGCYNHDARTSLVRLPKVNAMRTLGQIRTLVRKRRSEGKSDNSVARELGISGPEIKRLMMPNHYPGEKIAKELDIPVLCHVCKRRIATPRIRPSFTTMSVHQKWWHGLPPKQKDDYIEELYNTQ